MAAHRRLSKMVRNRVGGAAHRAGAATRGDIRHLRAELRSLREELRAISTRVDALVGHPGSSAGASGLQPPEPPPGTRIPSSPLTRRPTVSVVIPCYNYARFLAGAVGSVTAQDGVELDVLIIDDCSEDDTRQVAESLAAEDRRISVVVHKRNMGHIATFNEGIAAAEGEYLVLLSADDLLTPGSLARSAALLDAHPAVAFVYGDVVRFREEPLPTARQGDDGWTIWKGHDWIEARCRLGGNTIFSPEAVMRTSVQREIGEYRAELPHSADMEMWMRAAAVGDVGRIEGADQAFKRRHPASLSRALCTSPIDDLRARHDAFAATLGTCSSVPGAEALYGQARWALAVSALDHAVDRYTSLASREVDELEAFALEMFPSAKAMQQWLRLELCRSAAQLERNGAMSG